MFQCSNVLKFQSSKAPMFQYFNVLMFQFTNVPMLKCLNVLMFKSSNVQMFKSSNVHIFHIFFLAFESKYAFPPAIKNLCFWERVFLSFSNFKGFQFLGGGVFLSFYFPRISVFGERVFFLFSTISLFLR